MKPFLRLEEIKEKPPDLVGGKAFSLSRLHQNDIRVPKTFCIPCHVYDAYLAETRIRQRLLFEMNRKAFDKMRWEEIWDVSLRIRNLFLTTPLPQGIREPLAQEITTHCNGFPVAIRSSAPGEDDAKTSFAGVHESYLNIRGTDTILKHVKLVWASLYSDAALLYRKELGLDIHMSSMAVIIQELIASERSGVFFGVDPSDSNQSVVESVYGLNQGLVDGDIDPDRWMLDRLSGRIISHSEPERNRMATPDSQGVSIQSLPESFSLKPPLNEKQIRQVWETGKKAEALFERPQDMEWTFTRTGLVVLQSRPVTSSGFKDRDDKRAWYLSLHRSYENLNALHLKIENVLIPKMIFQAEEMGQSPCKEMTTRQLVQTIKTRQEIYDDWVRIYWADFIPFAHGIRLFGQIYNDTVKPEDPYEFMQLLERTNLKSIERNRILEKLADMARQDPGLKKSLKSGQEPGPNHDFMALLEDFVRKFGDLVCQTGNASECHHGNTAVIRLVLELAQRPPRLPLQKPATAMDALRENYLAGFPPKKQTFAKGVLHLARASYRLRDDDNIHLGRIEARLFEAVREGQDRLTDPAQSPRDLALLTSLPALSQTPEGDLVPEKKEPPGDVSPLWIKTRQILGHPAGPGIAKGPARIILTQGDLLYFKHGEILVCQGVDPNMTFVVPLAAAVVEERGGMLIHGAIIAREYGLPCVTGASQITQRIRTGDLLTVDGYLGIVTCDTGSPDP